jgi:hypothetical protein
MNIVTPTTPINVLDVRHDDGGGDDWLFSHRDGAM